MRDRSGRLERRAYLTHDRGGMKPSLIDLVMMRRGEVAAVSGHFISDLPVRRVKSIEDIPQGRCSPVSTSSPDAYNLITRKRRRK